MINMSVSSATTVTHCPLRAYSNALDIIRVLAPPLLILTLSYQTQTIRITLIQHWTNVEDVGPALYKCYTNVLCLLGWPIGALPLVL